MITMPWEGGSTREWRKIRARILERDSHVCQVRIKGVCTGRADCVHHVHGKAAGDRPTNLVASCTPCNLHIGDPTRHRGNNRSGRRVVVDPPAQPRTLW